MYITSLGCHRRTV